VSEQRPPEQQKPGIHDRTEPWVMALDETPEVGDAVNEDPLVQDDLSEGSVPLTARLRDRRTQLSIIVPVLVLLLFVVALPGFELDTLVNHILAADPVWLVAAFVVYYAGFPVRGYRWSLLLRGIGAKVRVRDSTEIVFVSWLVNSVVPAKLGEVYRAWLLKVNYPVSLSATFGTIFIERMFDIFAIVILGLGAAFWSFRTGLDDTVRAIMLLGIVVMVVIAIGLFSLRNFGKRLVERLPLPGKATELYEHFEEGVFSMDRRTLPMIAFLTLVIWTTEAIRLLFVVEALGFDISLGISGAFFVALVASLLTAVPFTPAGLGIVEAGIVGLLTVVYGADANEAAAIALVDRAISVLSVIVLGFIAYLLSPKTKGGRPAELIDDEAGASGAGESLRTDEEPTEQDATTA